MELLTWQNLAYAYIAINLVTTTTYAIDKGLALLRWRRISERTLICMTMALSGLGAIVGMLLFRHKIRKSKFWCYAILSVALQLVVVYLFYRFELI